MINKTILLLVIVTTFGSLSAYSQVGCRSSRFPGSYVRIDPPTDVFGDGTFTHQYVFNMMLNSNGTVQEFWSGTNDFPINTGTSSPSIGSWTCRADGKLVVNVLLSIFIPTAPGTGHPASDIRLVENQRWTFLFSVDDDNTLTRVQARLRRFGAGEDPTNPTAGLLTQIFTQPATYKRLLATDADLLLP